MENKGAPDRGGLASAYFSRTFSGMISVPAASTSKSISSASSVELNSGFKRGSACRAYMYPNRVDTSGDEVLFHLCQKLKENSDRRRIFTNVITKNE